MAAQPEQQSMRVGGEIRMAAGEEEPSRPLRAVPDPAPDAETEGEAVALPTLDPALAEPDEEIPEADPGIRPRSTWERLVSWVLARVDVPHLVTEDRPALRRIWRYARYSEQLPPQGPARVASLAYLYAVALPVVSVAYSAAWVVERPARAGITAAVLVLARLFEPTHVVLIVLLAPVKFLLFLLTN